MNFSLSPEQEALGGAFGRLFEKRSDPERVREVEPLGFDPDLWHALVAQGAVAMALPAALGGGATMVDLAVVAEQAGSHLASGPLAEAQIAARLLARLGETEWTDRIAAGEALVVFSPHERSAAPTPGAAVADAVVSLDGDRLVLVDQRDERPAHVPDLGCRAAALPDRSGALALATGDEAARAFALAVDEWRVLTACLLAGLSRRALDLGIQYVKERHQFGVPIGSFQSVQHRLADVHTAVEGARLLAYEAAWAWDEGEPNAPELAAMAYAWCGEQAEAAAVASLHYHGGYGFMVEYAIHLYVKRAKALRMALGDPAAQLVETARRRWGDRARPVPEPAAGERHLDFRLEPDSEAFRDEVRAFVAEHVTTEIIGRAHDTGTMHDWDLHRAIAARGYLSAGWPAEVGGGGRSAIETTTLMQELYRAGAPVDGMGIASMVAATLVLCGNDWQRAEILPKLLAGEIIPCLGYSEPDAGSDVAAVTTRAVRDGDEWVIDGQKMFTTMAHEAAYVFLLARTTPDKPKHRGLTTFLVPTDSPGIEVTPVHTLGGERTNITFYAGVRVPDRCRVGDVDAGWSVMHAALVYERNSSNWGEPDRLVEQVVEWARSNGRLDDPLVATRCAAAAIRSEIGRLLLYRTAWLAASGGLPQVEGSMTKLFITESFTRSASELLDATGEHVLDGMVEHAFRHSTVTTIYGGSSEIQRGIIAERGLGLPRTR
ncbi:MAG: acyl-CoA dehydrogenase [Acidimicrobiales bacterium]